MKHIQKIMINNARRFGENVEIDFGVGATIILASNGVGKTTVFEAIELALTNRIKRLENSPDAIIRDGFSEMNVRLDFSESKYCEVSYAKGGECIKKGDYEELFGTENNSSLPYLFRLTHFLEQRGKEWFVEQDDKSAGDLLSQLPLGKDLQHIISKRTSLLRAIGTTQTSATNALNEAKKQLFEFETLKTKRDGVAIETTLTPLEEIVAKLRPIGKMIGVEAFDDKYNVTRINIYFKKNRISLEQESNTKKALIISLDKLKERVNLYISNIELLSKNQIVISEQSKKIIELEPIVEQYKKKTQIAKENLSNLKGEIKKLNSVKSMFEGVEQKRIHIGVKRSNLEQNEKALGELKKSYGDTVDYLKKNERLQDQHKLANNAIKNKRNVLVHAEQKREFQKQWQVISKRMQEIIEKIMPEVEKRKIKSLELKSCLEKEVFEAEKVYSIKKKALESLNIVSGAIQNAISNIRKHLTEGQRGCPVCQANYEPDDLIKRIEGSLNTLNPSIPIAIEEEKSALKILELAKANQRDENQKLAAIQSELNTEHDKLDAHKKKISESFLPQFSGCKTPEEANIQLEEQIVLIMSQISELEDQKSKLEPEVIIEKINTANLTKSGNERSISELSRKNELFKNEIKIEIADIDNINKSLSGEDKETIFLNLSDKSIEVKKKTDVIEKLEETLSKNEAELKKHRDSLLSENEVASKIKSSQEGICAEWTLARLKGQPNEEGLKTKHEMVSRAIDELEKANKNLNTIEHDLASWRTAEKFHDINNEVKKHIGENSEEEYLETLKFSINKKNSTLLKIQEKKNAVDLFLANVKLESEQIYKQLNSINEPWKGLLKRIVINPLISTAPLLSNTTLRNKPIAKTSAIIHNQNIDIANIASEAQLTDLQLTLMLSMANKYEWTPWKALLLDDPTQHHDLVHASSVFDVLRDYIIDLDYQVMMSTHDSIQAKYFQRKLENEGVASKIYQLVSRKKGVTAERMA